MQSIDESVGFVELPTQTRSSAPYYSFDASVHLLAFFLGRFQLLRDLVDMGVERMKKLSCLRRVGVFEHSASSHEVSTACAK